MAPQRTIGSTNVDVTGCIEHTKSLDLALEIELLGFVDIRRKGRGRGGGADFTIQPLDSIDRIYKVETLTSKVV